ncbi:MAG: hypothetical protein K0S32_234 [Bacteroidetes bacterium]|jgi:hypothetical protein|nr:hypothetical protein [Bacteroidota bacterium]
MHFNIHDCYELLGALSLSVISIVMWALFYGFMALITSLVLMLVFKGVILVKRKHTALKVISIIHFIIVPIAFGYFGFKWGLIHNTENELKEASAKYTKPMNAGFDAAIQIAAGPLLEKNLSPNDFIDSLSSRVFIMFTGNMNASSAKKSVGGKLTGVGLGITQSLGTYAVKKSIREILEHTIRTDHDYTKDMMNKKVAEISNCGLFSKIAEMQIEHFFCKMKRGVIILLSIVLLFPIAEISIAHILHNKTTYKESLSQSNAETKEM